MSKAEIQICCERFKDFYEEGEIIYAYDLTNEIDETQWIIDGLAHIYYCPFCGKFIKGSAMGTMMKNILLSIQTSGFTDDRVDFGTWGSNLEL